MSIDKFDYQTYEVACDRRKEGKAGCLGIVNYVDVESFEDLIEELKADGWKIYKENGVWKHICEFH